MVSIIVCTYNRAELLPECLQSLVEQSLDPSLFEVIVVDNNSTDSTRDIASRFTRNHANIRIVTELSQGLSYARNRGWREARGEYVAYIDDDARATPDWCRLIVSAFMTVNPRPVAVGGKIVPIYMSTPPSWFDDSFETRTWGDTACFLSPDVARNGFSGSNMAISSTVLREYGGFSHNFGMIGNSTRTGEETEFFQRVARNQPVFWYDPAIEVRHVTPQRNLTMWYRFRRGYCAGIATRRMERAPICFARLRSAAILLALPALVFIRMIRSKRNRMTELAIVIQEAGLKLGYIVTSSNTWV